MKFSLLLFTIAAALTSCRSYQAHPLSAEASSAAFAGRSLSDPGLRQFLTEQKAEHGTWEVNRLALAAAYFHPDVIVARAEAGELAAAIKTAKQRPNPIFTFGPQGASILWELVKVPLLLGASLLAYRLLATLPAIRWLLRTQ
jgi:hypothetical protein